MQDVYSWFFDITGMQEAQWLERRHETILQAPNGDLQIQNILTGDIYEAGAFTVYSIEELSHSICTEMQKIPPFEVHVRTNDAGLPYVDVAYLQAKAKDRTLFQVASNFNCAEVPHVTTYPNYGSFVSNLAIDSTQGPAASASAGVSSITRVHAPFYSPYTDANLWGQTRDRQIELLGHALVKPHFPVINGKLWFHGTEPREYNPEEIFPHIRVGLHRRVRPYFGQRHASFMEKVVNPSLIDQVFVAALNRRAPKPYEEHLHSKTTILLQAAYQGTYQSANLCNSEQLVLTLIGGGVFANPPDLIAKAIASAHKNWGGCTALTKVILPLYPINGDVQGEDFVELLRDAFIEHNMLSLLTIKNVSHLS